MTALYAVIGQPIGHSLSPVMMRAAFEALGLDATYVALEVAPDALPRAIDGVRALGLGGLNVTIPHKERVVALLDALSPAARAIGAVNTIAREGAKLTGHNTDVDGFLDAVRETGRDVAGARAVLLGAGGAARAVAAGLAGAGVTSLQIAARAPARAEALVSGLGPALPGPRWSHAALDGGLDLAGVDLVVNCTPAGMSGGPDGTGLATSLALPSLPAGALVVDLIYRPRETMLLTRARSLGLATLDGLPMLLHQGARAFALWTGRPAPVDAMRRALEACCP